jgi:hypothetical protein
MQIRCSVILPVFGLVLFAVVTYKSMSMNPPAEGVPNKYYWWSSLRLDTDPLNKHPKPAAPCEKKEANCVDLRPPVTHVTPALLDRLLTYSALPAFLAGAGLVIALSKRGIDEVLTFMVSMPIFLFFWFFFVGWLLDRLIIRLLQPKNVTPLKLT